MIRVQIRTLAALVASAAVGGAGLPAVANADFRIGVDEPTMGSGKLSSADWEPLIKPTGATLIRRFIHWYKLAPTRPINPSDPNDPVYIGTKGDGGRWAPTDTVARVAAQQGAETILSVLAAPEWAEGPNRPNTGYGRDGKSAPYRGSWKPDAAALGAFATAIARRYNGSTPDPLKPGKTLPRIALYEAWNEPNYQMFLSPQCSKGRMVPGNVCSSGGKVVASSYYRVMLNSFYDGIKAVQPNATVGTAGLGPYGSSSQGFEIDPQVFARSILCLRGTSSKPTVAAASSCPVKAKLDALSFHPYTLAGKPTSRAASPNGGSLGNAPDLRKALDLAVAAGTILPAGPKELWESETGWMTCPPCRTTTTAGQTMGISPSLAATYTAEMIYRAWSWGVQKLVWYGLIDSGRYGWPVGLYYQCALGATVRLADCPSAKLADALAKPALSAFRFPIFSAKASSKTAFSWVLSPCKVPGSTVSFELLNSSTKRWSPLTVPGPIDPKTKKPTSVPLVLTLPTGTDGTAKSALWAIPTWTSSIRATASGAGCTTETSIAMPIAAK